MAVTFDTAPSECRERNRQRPRPIPADALAAQLRKWRSVRDLIETEGFDSVIGASPVRIVPKTFEAASKAAGRQVEHPVGLRFGLHLGSYTFAGGASATQAAVRQIATSGEAAGFHSIYVMDHFRQIPQIGRSWEDFLESYTTLGYLAACTERVRLGALVTGITYRNPAHLAKIISTLDILSGGRALCGLGLAWHRERALAYGWDFPSTAERYLILEDTLQLLPLMWGAGTPSYEGKRITVPETLCYPRPLSGPCTHHHRRRWRAPHTTTSRPLRRRRQRDRRQGRGSPQGGRATSARGGRGAKPAKTLRSPTCRQFL